MPQWDLGITRYALSLSVALRIHKGPRRSSGEIQSSQVFLEPSAQPGCTLADGSSRAASVAHADPGETHTT